MSHLRALQFNLSTPDSPQLNQILASAKRLFPGTCDDGDTETGFAIEPLEDFAHFGVSGVGKAVHGFFAVDGYEEDVGCGIGEEDMGGWRGGDLQTVGRHGGGGG
jgi:hypothetical protein